MRVSNSFYWDDALVEHIGKPVQYVRTRDAGRVIVYTANAAPKFVCIAVDPESAGFDREVLTLAAKQRQAEVMRQGMEELRELKRKHRPENIHREIINHAVASSKVIFASDSRGAGEVSPLPYRSAALTAAAAALKALEKPSEPAPHDQETLNEGARALEEMERRRELRELQLDDDQLDVLWVAIRREPRTLTLREQRFLAHYGNTPDSWAASDETTTAYSAMRRLDDLYRREKETECAQKSA